jgi:bifunctional N-acetylglucosamine-1-phosphate-uridyltransferase/glucosamine-1-phosphate-acetyltransferase GlmU-like protein
VRAPGSLLGPDGAAPYGEGWQPTPQATAAVIAAAGRGTRLGFHLPKVLYPIEGRPLLEWIGARLAGLAGSLVLVLSPDGEQSFRQAPVALPMPMSIAVQNEPTGMADAILAVEQIVTANPTLETLIVIWGDQIGVQRETIEQALAVHARHPLQPAVTIPFARVDAPYVHYEFDAAGRLLSVLQRREGDALPSAGLADCGCFVIAPRVIFPALRRLRTAGLLRGRFSREENFVQALPFLAREAPVVGVMGATVADTIGLNSVADLERLSRATDRRRSES